MAEDHPRLVRALTLACGDPQVAEDAVQEALVRACERLERGEQITSLAGWIAVVAMNDARSTYRRRAAERRARERIEQRVLHASSAIGDSTADPVVRALDHDERAAALQLAILQLPTRQREVTVLHYYLHHDVRTIAELLDVTPGAVKNALFNARASLATHLSPDDASAGAAPAAPAAPSRGGSHG